MRFVVYGVTGLLVFWWAAVAGYVWGMIRLSFCVGRSIFDKHDSSVIGKLTSMCSKESGVSKAAVDHLERKLHELQPDEEMLVSASLLEGAYGSVEQAMEWYTARGAKLLGPVVGAFSGEESYYVRKAPGGA